MLLDEMTSALDEPSALALLQMLKAQLPTSSIVLVSHQSFVDQLADKHLRLSETTRNTPFMTGTPEYAS